VWLILLGLLSCLLIAPSAGAQRSPANITPKNILVVYSFADRKEFSAIDDLKSRMRSVIRWPLNFYVENIESRRFDDKNYEEDLVDNLKNTYDHLKFDLIVPDNFPALEFVLRHRSELFPVTPIVFFDLDESWLAAQKLPPGVTGVTAVVDIKATIDLALRLHPSTSNIAVVIDNSPYERYWLGRIRSEIARRQNKLSEIDLVALPAGEIMQRVDQLPPNTIVLFQLSYQETEQPAIELPELAAWIGRRLPTYSIFPWNCINHEGIGGDSFDGYRQISLVSEVARRVLSGERPERIPVVHDTSHHIVADWRMVRSWHIPESAFPPGSEFVNREPTVWQRYRGYILAAIAVIIAQALLIAALLWQRARKRKAEAVLRESEERFRVLANNTPALIWMSDAHGKITYLNDRRIEFTGQDTDAGYGDTWVSYIHPDDVHYVLERFSNALKTRKSFSREYRLRRTDGVYRWVLNVGSPRVNGDGSFAGFIGSIIDISDQKLAREALQKLSGQLIEAQEKERRRIARELHDDICQRLALLSVELGQASRSSNGSAGKLEDIRKHCSEIANDVQTLSHKLHSSKLDYLGIGPALKGFCEEFSRQHEVTVEFRERNVPGDVPSDSALCLFRVTQEALRNAMKYSRTNSFAVELTSVADEVQLEVRDWGAGFDVQEARRSHGLGLVSMRERVNLVHGRFSIESTPGEGTRVIAVVPLAAQNEASPEELTVTEAASETETA
jgi:PAS domain S-box-containing protein